MSSFSLTFNNIWSALVAVLDILVVWLILYYALRLVRNSSRTIQIFKGIILIVVIDFLSKAIGLKTLAFFADMFINWGFLAVIIIFQPEIRSILEKIGNSNVFSRITTLSDNQKEKLVDQIVTAVMLLSKDQTGALISIEQSHSMGDFIATGTKLNSDVSAELLTSIFVTSTPLHDGAVIIQGDKIACASAYFPPTNLDLPSRYGARHRAAIGISEISDCVTIVVSEETGGVSITENGRITTVNREELAKYLQRVILGASTEVKKNSHNDTTNELEPIEKEAVEKTSVLSKIAIKKQESPKQEKTNKVIVEEVKPAGSQEGQKVPVEVIHAQADQEARSADIKLPHKKQRPTPSYPTQSQRPKRMTSEEVEAARQATTNSYRQTDTKMESADDFISRPILNSENEKKYDTSKLDITKIVGFNDELNRQFEMVDNLDQSGSSANEGGASHGA